MLNPKTQTMHPSPAASAEFRPDRQGMALIFVLVALAVVTALFGSLLKMAAAGSRRSATQFHRTQAGYLAQSALERAVARLGQDASYTGETWKLPAAELPGDWPASVAIIVEPNADGASRVITVEADYPDDPRHGCRATLRAVVDMPLATGENP